MSLYSRGDLLISIQRMLKYIDMFWLNEPKGCWIAPHLEVNDSRYSRAKLCSR